MAEIRQWLTKLGLERYGDVFVENEIEISTLRHLGEADLKELGLPMGPRKVVMAAIEALGPDGATDDPAPPVGPAPGDAERRQLVIWFCDLVDSTGLSGRVDPEDMREVVRHYQAAAVAAVTSHGGHVANFLGDGVVAYFGWPAAAEDQAEQAVRAGLAAALDVSAIALPGRLTEVLAARVGIATGQVVIGDLLDDAVSQQGLVTGATPNLAARLQSAAPPGGVVIEATTRALVRQSFDLEDLGPQDLKGFETPIQAWRVRAARTAESRFDSRAETLTPLAGRTHEVGLLCDRWEQARSGEGQVVLIAGEAGIGKSRILQAFRAEVEDRPQQWLSFQCSPYHVNTALHPVIQQLEHAAGFEAGDAAAARLDKVEALLRQGAADIAAIAPLIAALLSLPARRATALWI